MSLFKKISIFPGNEKYLGLIDNVKDRRIGLIYLKHSDNYDSYHMITIPSFIKVGKYGVSDYNIILEVKEIFNDKELSKVEIIHIPYNTCDAGKKCLSKFNPWVESSIVYWLSPSIPIDRDNKLNEILN